MSQQSGRRGARTDGCPGTSTSSGTPASSPAQAAVAPPKHATRAASTAAALDAGSAGIVRRHRPDKRPHGVDCRAPGAARRPRRMRPAARAARRPPRSWAPDIGSPPPQDAQSICIVYEMQACSPKSAPSCMRSSKRAREAALGKRAQSAPARVDASRVRTTLCQPQSQHVRSPHDSRCLRAARAPGSPSLP